jgi:hypothetical protein
VQIAQQRDRHDKPSDLRYVWPHLSARPGLSMSNGTSLSLQELEARIAIARDNIRQLIEQSAAQSGAEDEDRNADRLAQQQAELDRLTQQRDALLKKK